MQELSTFISNHLLLSVAAIAILVLLLIIEFLRAKRNTVNITPLQTTQLINHDNGVVIDVRSQDAYRKGHIIDAYSISGQELQTSTKKIEKFRARPIIIVCNMGVESQKIASLLLKNGYNAYSLAGGMRGWEEAQMPIVKD